MWQCKGEMVHECCNYRQSPEERRIWRQNAEGRAFPPGNRAYRPATDQRLIPCFGAQERRSFASPPTLTTVCSKDGKWVRKPGFLGFWKPLKVQILVLFHVLADRTINYGRTYDTMLCPSVVCLSSVTYMNQIGLPDRYPVVPIRTSLWSPFPQTGDSDCIRNICIAV